MPSILIEVRKQYSPEQEIALIEAMHTALMEAFDIKSTAKNVRLVVHEPHRFACPPHLEKPECYTFIRIDAMTGRSLEAKRALYQKIVQQLEGFGVPRDHSQIVLHESAAENWGIRGGQAACDIGVSPVKR